MALAVLNERLVNIRELFRVKCGYIAPRTTFCVWAGVKWVQTVRVADAQKFLVFRMLTFPVQIDFVSATNSIIL